MSQRSNYSDQFLTDALPVLDALIYNEYGKHEDLVSKIINVQSSSRWGEQTSSMAGIKAAVAKSEGSVVAFDDPIQGYDQTYTHTTYAIATSFSEELIEDNRLEMVQKTYRSLGLAMFQTRQIQAMAVLNNGFSVAGPDGSSLFATGHTLINGASAANRPSTDVAVSVAGLRDMEVTLMKQVNHRSINVLLMPKMIVAPPDVSHTLMELLKSQDRPDTANRAMNTFYSKNYEACISPFLTSTTAWMALADKSSHELMFFERVAPSTKTWEDEKTGDVNTRIRCRFSAGYSDFIGTWGTSG
jgi:phage major head subunit gpT-like protein